MAMVGDRDREADQDAERMHVGYAVAGALDRLSKARGPAAEKKKLVGHILRVVDDPGMDHSIAGRAADLVLEAKVPEGKLQEILRDITEIRRAAREGKGQGFRSSPGAFFLFKVRQWPEWIQAKGER